MTMLSIGESGMRKPMRSRDGIREDLLNTAALQTLLHGGQVFGLQRQDMPEKAEAAALLRF